MPRSPSLIALVGLLVAPGAAAQDVNPRGAVTIEVGAASVSIDYGRPGLDGRALSALMGMLPEDRVWRAGQNQVTTMEASAPVTIGGETIPAGRYSLYLHIPESGGWHLLVNRNQGIPLGELSSQAPADMHDELWPAVARYGQIEDEEQARIALDETEAPSDGDIFEIAAEAGMIRFSWGGVAYQTSLGAP